MAQQYQHKKDTIILFDEVVEQDYIDKDLSVSQIAKLYGTTEYYIRICLIRRKVKMRPAGGDHGQYKHGKHRALGLYKKHNMEGGK